MSFKYSADGQYIQTSLKANIKEKNSVKLVNQLLGVEQFSDDEIEHFDSFNNEPFNNEPLDWFSMNKEAKRALQVNPPILNYNDFIDQVNSETDDNMSQRNYSDVLSENSFYDTDIIQKYDKPHRISSSQPLNFVPDRLSPSSPASVNGAVLDNCCNGTTFQRCLETEPEFVCMQNCKNICPLKF